MERVFDELKYSTNEEKASILAESHALIDAAAELMGTKTGFSYAESSDQELLEEALLTRYEERDLLS